MSSNNHGKKVESALLPDFNSLSNQSMQRLQFRLKEFTRCSWVSDRARELWEPRFRRISNCLNELQWRTVQAGLRQCALLSMSPDEFTANSSSAQYSGLTVQSLGKMAATSTYTASLANAQPGGPFNYWVALGNEANVQRLGTAHHENDQETVGQLLGYPECCRRFFDQVWVQNGHIDTSWPMVEHVQNGNGSSVACVEISKPSLCNILLRWIGLRAVFHLPCSFDCQPSIRCATQIMQLGNDSGFECEMAWLTEALNWPVEWSALHGIAEIKTPLFKVSTCTDATPVKYMIRYIGSDYPEAGAVGLNFPYRLPTLRKLSDSRQFKEGLANPLPVQKPAHHGKEWYQDNGFASMHGMEASHAPLVEFANVHFRHIEGRVIDLGCGNGALINRICIADDRLIPAGIDLSSDKIQRAQDLMPKHADHFRVGNLIECFDHSNTTKFSAGLLMLGRLAEHPDDDASRFLSMLQDRVGRLIVYAYDDYLVHQCVSLGDLASRFGLELQHYQRHPLISLGYIDLPLSSQCERRVDRIEPASCTNRSADMETQSHGDAHLTEDIQWERIAEPQGDQYDTKVALEYAKQKGYPASDIVNSPTFCDGRVAIRSDDRILEPYCTAAKHDHPNIERGGNLLRFWPEAFSQFQSLIDTVSVFYDPDRPEDLVVGSICGPGEGGFGKIAATVTHHVGFAEALVHEMAHHKLRALGVFFDRSERIVANDPSQAYLSPIRHDVKRPMVAVLHAQYSYTYVTALDNAIVRARSEPDRDAIIARAAIAVNLPKLQFGLREIRENIVTDTCGEAFLSGFYSWSERMFAESLSILDELRIPLQVFRHPLA